LIRIIGIVLALLLAAPGRGRGPIPAAPIKLLVADPAGRGRPMYVAARADRPAICRRRWAQAGGDRESHRRQRQYRGRTPVAKSDPDGYTLLLGADPPASSSTRMSTASCPSIRCGISCRSRAVAANQFHPGGQSGGFRPGIFGAFVAHARRARPIRRSPTRRGGKRQASTSFAMELLKRRAGINLLHVPYPRRARRRRPATIAGETQVLLSPAPRAAANSRQDGCARSAMSGKRSARCAFPELPTIGGVLSGL